MKVRTGREDLNVSGTHGRCSDREAAQLDAVGLGWLSCGTCLICPFSLRLWGWSSLTA